MKLIVGLGNPGPRYKFTRHNIGFMLIDVIAMDLKVRQFKVEHKAETAKVSLRGQPSLLVKPQTFMNLSGESVRSIMDFYKIERADLLVVHDDIDQSLGQLRFHIRRGHGGHNGIRSIHQVLGSDDYARLKLGVGRPLHPDHDVADYVLGEFAREEESTLQEVLGQAVEAVEFWCEKGTDRAANLFNSMKTEKPS